MLSDGFHKVPTGKLAMVVTHLEMTQAAPQRPVPLPDGVELRSVPTPSVDWFKDIFHRIGSQDWLWFSRLKMTDAALMEIISDPLVEIFTLSKDGKDEALLELDFRTEGECEIAYFGLAAPLIGSGVGRFLMNHAITQAWARPITRFHLHTCTLDSQQALAFYIRRGFTPTRQEIEIEDDPRQTGLLPLTAAPHVPVIPKT